MLGSRKWRPCASRTRSSGSTAAKHQREQLTAEAVASGEIIELNQDKLPGCYFHRTAKNDVARTEHLTYICTPKQGRRRPHQQLDEPRGGLPQGRRDLQGLDEGPDHVRHPLLARAGRLGVLQVSAWS